MNAARVWITGLSVVLAGLCMGVSPGKSASDFVPERETGGARRFAMVRVVAPVVGITAKNAIDAVVARILKSGDFEGNIVRTIPNEFTGADGFQYYESCTTFVDDEYAHRAYRVLVDELRSLEIESIRRYVPVFLDDRCSSDTSLDKTTPPADTVPWEPGQGSRMW